MKQTLDTRIPGRLQAMRTCGITGADVYIGYTLWSKNPHKTFYVANLPGDGGVDWGYTEKREQAIPLSVYWRRRFESDMVRCNRVAAFVPL